MTSFGDLLGPAPILLPENTGAQQRLAAGDEPELVAAAHPAASLPWALLAERALDRGETIAGYAYARTGYHRGLDLLRRSGWKGGGPVPWSHEPNRGYLRCVAALARAAQAIGEEHEYVRCLDLLKDGDPQAARELGLA